MEADSTQLPRPGVRVLAVMLAVTLALSSAPVRADVTADDKSAGAVLKKKGDVAMDKLDYEAAIAAYAEAWSRAHDPAVLYNKGRAHQALAQFPEALRELELFDKEAPAALKAKVPKLAELIAEIRAKVSTLTLHCNVKTARVLVRDRVAALDTPFQLQAGPATIEVTAEGYSPFKKDVTLPGGSELTVDAELTVKITTGLLTVKSPVVGAEALVDGKPAGKVPAQLTVEPGSHRVLVRAPGYDEKTVTTVMNAGGAREVTVDLEKQPGITSKWWFWTGVSVVVIGGGVLTYSLLTERRADSGDFSPGRVSGPLVRF